MLDLFDLENPDDIIRFLVMNDSISLICGESDPSSPLVSTGDRNLDGLLIELLSLLLHTIVMDIDISEVELHDVIYINDIVEHLGESFLQEVS